MWDGNAREVETKFDGSVPNLGETEEGSEGKGREMKVVMVGRRMNRKLFCRNEDEVGGETKEGARGREPGGMQEK